MKPGRSSSLDFCVFCSTQCPEITSVFGRSAPAASNASLPARNGLDRIFSFIDYQHFLIFSHLFSSYHHPYACKALVSSWSKLSINQYLPQRQSRSRSAPRSAPAQSRGAHTAAAPAGFASAPRTTTPLHAPAPPAGVNATAQPKQPGMMAQMAATAGSVALGSTIGHGISSMLFGGGAREAPQQEAPPVQQQQFQNQSGISCEVQAKGNMFNH